LQRPLVWIALAAVCLGGALLLRTVAQGSPDPEDTMLAGVVVADSVTVQPLDHAGDLEAAAAAPETPEVADDGLDILPVDAPEADLVIGKRETFYDAMRRLDAGHGDIMALVAACKPYRDLGKVRGGMAFRVAVAPGGDVRRLRFDLDDDESYMVFDRQDDGYAVHMLTYPVERRTVVVAGVVESSLYESLQEAGAPSALASKLNDILGWDVDFRRDVRHGDTFRILYEEVYRDGEFVRTGPILACEYVNKGDVHRGFRYDDADGRPGYYDADGRNLEKQLMRAPLEYSRISDSFSPRRFHPVKKRWAPHWGVDYAAPVGTPVRAAGSGVVEAATSKEGNGRYVHIRHTNASYETYYLHLSRFAKGIKRGAKVRQGEVIGYVGATGWATGPHLDYRVKVDGRWQNPRTLKLPPAEPLRGEDLLAFRAQVALNCYSLAAAPSSCAAWPVERDRPLCPPFLPTGPLAPAAVQLASLIPATPTVP